MDNVNLCNLQCQLVLKIVGSMVFHVLAIKDIIKSDLDFVGNVLMEHFGMVLSAVKNINVIMDSL